MIDAHKHREVFNPDDFKHPVHIIGAGATGSKVAVEVAKLGISNITVWDADNIEAHNVANQAYGNCHIGLPKVHCLSEEIERLTDYKVKARNEWVKDQRNEFAGFVFLLVDDMDTRMEIHQKCLRMNKKVKRVIETRLAVKGGRIYAYNPFSPAECKKWEAAWYPNEDTVVSACGFYPTVGPTASLIASLAVWEMMEPGEGFVEKWIGLEQIVNL
jgi:molybdopterin/thiamine biosynthesis adenylyltransferase